jgi:hypothetical protein
MENPEGKYIHPISSMRGHREKGGDCCKYHEGKVGNSTKPGPEVYGIEHLEKIQALLEAQDVELKDVGHLIFESLLIVDKYWQDYRDELDTTLYQTHQKASAACNYLAGGWQASPQQYSQLFTVIWSLAQKDALKPNSRLLRAGTASGQHTKQLTEVFDLVGIKPEIFLVDLCKPPLAESSEDVDSLFQGNIANLPLNDNSIDILTGHVVDSFLVKEAQTHEEAISKRKEIYSELRRVMSENGCLCMLIGTSDHIARLNSSREIVKMLESAGFKTPIILPTTDPLDYDKENQTHSDGNYFVVAFN